MEAFLISFFAVAIAEIGDKTQLIALLLAVRFHRPVPVILGIFVATLASQLAASLLGQWIGTWLQESLLHGLLAFSFLGTAIWAFIPEKMEHDASQPLRHTIFLTSFLTFFVAELGDKTQIATVALAAQFHSLAAVLIGTTFALMAVNIPTVIMSRSIAKRIPIYLMKALSGILFICLSLYEFCHLLFY